MNQRDLNKLKDDAIDILGIAQEICDESDDDILLSDALSAIKIAHDDWLQQS